MDKGFLGKINGPFLCLTAAILSHSLRCWWTGNFIDNVAFTRASSKGKTNNLDLRFSDVSGSLGAQAHMHPILVKTTGTKMGDKPPNEMIGLLEGQIQTWSARTAMGSRGESGGFR